MGWGLHHIQLLLFGVLLLILAIVRVMPQHKSIDLDRTESEVKPHSGIVYVIPASRLLSCHPCAWDGRMIDVAWHIMRA